MKQHPIRIAHIMGKMIGGGVESVVMNYYKNINREKLQFDFICDKDSTNIPYEEIEALGGKVIIIPPYQNLSQYIKELTKVFKKNNYKIVHSHINTLSVFPLYVAKKCKIPIRIAHSHSTTNKKEIKRNILKQILRPFSKKYATNYFCCGELAGRWQFGNKTYNQNKVYLLNNAIDLEKFTYNKTIRQNTRKKLNIKEDTLVIGHIGRFVTTKNHLFILEIFKEILTKNPNSLLLLVGQGPLKEEIIKKIKSLNIEDKVKLLGQLKETNEIYQALDVFLLPSLYEGLPVVGIEAQAAGLLCIFSDKITKKLKILNESTFISLDTKKEEWSKIIIEKSKQHTKKNTKKELQKANYDIKIEATKLEKKYLELLKDLNNGKR